MKNVMMLCIFAKTHSTVQNTDYFSTFEVKKLENVDCLFRKILSDDPQNLLS